MIENKILDINKKQFVIKKYCDKLPPTNGYTLA